MKRIHSLSIAALSALLAASSSLVAGTVKGRVLGADGRPPISADVHLYRYGAGIGAAVPIATTTAESDGSFTLDIPDGVAFTLVATGVNHNYASVTLPAPDGNSDVNLDITLASLPYASKIDTVKVIGDWNGFSFSNAATMKRQPNGTYVYEAKVPGATEVSYQLMGIVGEGDQRLARSVNGPGGVRYEYDGAGDYRTIVPVTKGKARIVFDPKALPSTGQRQPAHFTFSGASDWMNRVAAIDGAKERIMAIMQERQVALMPIVLKAQQNGVEPDQNELRTAAAPFKTQLGEATGSIRTALTDQHQTVRAFAAIALAEQQGIDSVTALSILKALPADNPLWKLSPRGLTSVGFRIPSSEWGNYEAAVGRNPWRGAALNAAAGKLMVAAYGDGNSNPAKVEEMYTEISRNFAKELQDPENAEVVSMLSNFDPNRAIKVGKAVPDFSVKLMNGGTASRASMMGKTYLIDFWAVWCGPCRAELPGLHAAYDKYKSRGLEVLSLSFDEKPADVTKFRKGAKTPMPWMHSFVEGSFNSPLAKAFEVEGIPKPILVGPDGTIIATEGNLRGPALEQTLERALPKDRAGR